MIKGTVVEEYMPKVRIHALSVLKDRKVPYWVEKDDLISEGYLALVRCAKRYKPDRGAQFATYAHRRVCGAMQDYIRAGGFAGRRQGVVFCPVDELKKELSPEPEQRPQELNYINRIKRTIERLPRTQRIAIMLHYYDERDIVSIAQILGVPRTRIYKLIYLGIENIKKACYRINVS